MKLSTKLLIGLLGTMLVMMLISAFSIKSEFEKINQKDLFWNSIKISNKPFKHLKVIGQKDAEGTVNILNGKFFGNSKKFEINIPKQWAEEVKISFEKDTLIVNFLVKPIKNNNSNYRQNSAVMHIICPEVSSIKGERTKIHIDSLSQDKLYIEATKTALIDITRLNVSSLSIKLDENSNCEFRYDRIYNLENLEANVAAGAILKMRYVYPKKFILNTTEKSVVEMNGTALGLLRK